MHQGGAKALGVLAPHLPPELLAEALQVAPARADALSGLAPYLPPQLLLKAFKKLYAIKSLAPAGLGRRAGAR